MATFFRTDGWVKSAVGPAVPGAQVFVCAPQPANQVVPPTPLTDIFSDPNGLVPITQPIITDGFGHYDFYSVPKIATIIIVLGGVIQEVLPDQSIGGFGTSNPPGNDSGLVAGTNITIVGNTINAIVSSGVELQTNGVDNALQTKLNLKSSLGIGLAADGAGGVTISLATPGLSSITGFGNWSGFRVVVDGGASIGDVWGASTGSAQTGTTPLAQVDSTATDTNYCSMSSTASAGTIGGYNLTSNILGPTMGSTLSYQTRVQLQQTTGCRSWMCFVDSTSAPPQQLKATNPAFNIVGFRYDTSAGDTGWVGYCSTDATHVTTTAAGPAMDTLGHSLIFVVSNNGASITFYVDGTAIGTISTNIPSASTHLNVVGTIDNLSNAVAKFVNVAYCTIADKF